MPSTGSKRLRGSITMESVETVFVKPRSSLSRSAPFTMLWFMP